MSVLYNFSEIFQYYIFSSTNFHNYNLIEISILHKCRVININYYLNLETDEFYQDN